MDAPRLQVPQRSLIKAQHLLLVGQVGQGRRKRHDGWLTFSGREGSWETARGPDGRKGGPSGGHFRFRRGGVGAAVMSRFKFVGKSSVFPLPALYSDCPRASLAAATAAGMSSAAFWRLKRRLWEEGAGNVLV